ncbi:MAG: hypothetical protein Kow0077_11970 [Anaerolineae bacterium]
MRKPVYWLWIGLLGLILLAACAPAPAPPPTPTPAPEVTDPAALLEWDTSPDAVVFRIDLAGTSGDRASDLNAVPYCTIFGDGHIIWLNPGTNPEEVLEALLDESTLRTFLYSLITEGFYEWEPHQTGAPQGRGEGTPRERILLTLFDEAHVVEDNASLPPGAFARIRERCRQLSDSPVLYVPMGVWVSALPTTERVNRTYNWANYRAMFDDVRLADMSPEQPRWFTGEAAAQAWELARRGRVVLVEDGATYRLVVQVPGLHAGVPDAPR